MLKKSIYCLLLTSALTLSGCATNADVSSMTVGSGKVNHLKTSALKHSIEVANVSGGHETNPLWTSQINNENFKSALENSLQNSNLLGRNNSKYVLSAQLVKLDQPILGLDLKVSCLVHYKLTNEKTNKVLFNRDIATSYTATFSDSPIATTRLKMANEGVIRANITELLGDLSHLSA